MSAPARRLRFGTIARAAVLLVLMGGLVVAIRSRPGQWRNLSAVDKWREGSALQADMAAFQREKGVTFRLFSQTRHDGVVGVVVEGDSIKAHAEILEFVMSHDPPRPVEIMLLHANGPATIQLHQVGK